MPNWEHTNNKMPPLDRTRPAAIPVTGGVVLPIGELKHICPLPQQRGIWFHKERRLIQEGDVFKCSCGAEYTWKYSYEDW